MDISVNLNHLTTYHPNLLWDDIIAATVAVLSHHGANSPFDLKLVVDAIPGFDDNILQLRLDDSGVAEARITRLKRTYEPARLVELAAIAIAGVGLYHAGGYVIHDVAMRGSAADYLVGEENCLLEVAGRSRRSDFQSTWESKVQRLRDSTRVDFLVCVVEFETPAGRLAFFE
jgi:hypothetical protein